MMNSPDDCDLLGKVVHLTNVHEHNDVTVSIKLPATIQISLCRVCML